MSAEIDAELYVCPAEDLSRCDLIGPYRVAPHHHCNHDDGHPPPHECACGHRWGDDDD